MEKAIVFGPLIVFFGFFGLLILGFFILIAKLISKSKNEYWSGVVLDKKHNQVKDSDDRTHNYYYLIVKTTDGRERKIGLSSALWDNFSVGDNLTKPKGKLLPEKVV